MCLISSISTILRSRILSQSESLFFNRYCKHYFDCYLLSNAQFNSIHFSHSVVSDSATPWSAARQASLAIANSQSLLKFMSIESVMPSNHLILRRPLLLLPSVFPSIRGFSNESALRIRWPKYWSFSFSISRKLSCSNGMLSW